jgi:cation-transporting ATPase 13A1
MRKILYASERVSTNDKETFYFIALLVLFALIASAVVLYEGLYDESRNKFKLVCICSYVVV